MHLAVPRGRARPSIDDPPVEVHSFAAGTFELGREHLEVAPGERVTIYDPVRSVADAVRLRNRIGTDLAFGVARRLLEGRRAAEVYNRLRRLARERGRATHELLQFYLLERVVQFSDPVLDGSIRSATWGPANRRWQRGCR